MQVNSHWMFGCSWYSRSIWVFIWIYCAFNRHVFNLFFILLKIGSKVLFDFLLHEFYENVFAFSHFFFLCIFFIIFLCSTTCDTKTYTFFYFIYFFLPFRSKGNIIVIIMSQIVWFPFVYGNWQFIGRHKNPLISLEFSAMTFNWFILIWFQLKQLNHYFRSIQWMRIHVQTD